MKRVLTTLLLILGMFSVSMAKDNSVEQIKEKGYFIVGLDATFAPLGFRDKNGEVVGFDVDLAKEVAKRMGVEVKFKSCDWSGIIFELKSRNIDMIWNGLTATPGRAKQASLSKEYLSDSQLIFTRKDQGVFKVSDLKNKVVGVQLGSSGAITVEKSSIRKEIKDVKKYSTNVEALLDLEAGRIDAVIMDEISGKYYNAKKGTLLHSEEALAHEGFVVAFRKNEKALTDEVNRLLDELKADGTFDKISQKWFGE